MPINEPETEIKTIGDLVLNHYICGNTQLIINLPPHLSKNLEINADNFQLDSNSLCFPSIEARDQFLADSLFDKNRAISQQNPNKWLQVAHEVWRHEIGNSESVAGRFLAILHKTDDIFLIAASAIKREVVPENRTVC
ncbi:hypothetical protein [Geobacter pickeringii]|uniref:hypothetical protein n=1 Tax=Geobacter pickeringii TaxID=345632 RepID=UPI0011854E0C|nr:hypothetical protein [Geobacter pickeringii]